MLVLALLLLAGSPALAQITFFTSSSFAESGKPSSTLTLAIGCATGSLVRVTLADRVGGSTPTIADIKGNSWTLLAGPTTNTVRKTEWYSIISNGGLLSIRISFDSSTASRAAVGAVFRGISSSSPLDANPADLTGNATPFNAPSSGNLTQASELVTGGFALTGSTDDTIATSTEKGVVSVGTNSIYRVDSVSGSGGGDAPATTVVTSALNTQPGDLIVLLGSDQIGTGSFTITDSLGNTVHSLKSSTNAVRMTPGYIVVAPSKSGATTYTATFSPTSNYRTLLAVQYRGLSATPFDVNPENLNTSDRNVVSPSSGTLGQQRELVLGFFAEKGNDAWGPGPNVQVRDQSLSGGTMTTGVGAVITTRIVNDTPAVTESIFCGTIFDGVSGIASFRGASTSETVAAMSYRIVDSTAAVAPQITDTGNRSAVMGTSTFKAQSGR